MLQNFITKVIKTLKSDPFDLLRQSLTVSFQMKVSLLSRNSTVDSLNNFQSQKFELISLFIATFIEDQLTMLSTEDEWTTEEEIQVE